MPIDLRSDTVTRPSPEMRQVMANADVGDDILDGDPSVRRLEERVAQLLGKERALFFPSGTMANQTGVWVNTQPGTEILLDAGAHIIHYEAGGAAALSGVQPRAVSSEQGPVMDAAALRAAIRPASPYSLSPSAVCFENTNNGAGGVVTPLGALRAMHDVAREHDLAIHMDGARLWNAHVASGTSLADFAACADTVMVSFSKGLGAPVGAALAGTADVMQRAWLVRKRFGGAMRQSGILAAGALFGLETNLSALASDHARARRFGDMVDGAGGVHVVPPDTNIVMIDLPPGRGEAESIVRYAVERGVLISAWTRTRVRAVFHRDVDDRGTDEAGRVVREAALRL